MCVKIHLKLTAACVCVVKVLLAWGRYCSYMLISPVFLLSILSPRAGKVVPVSWCCCDVRAPGTWA